MTLLENLRVVALDFRHSKYDPYNSTTDLYYSRWLNMQGQQYRKTKSKINIDRIHTFLPESEKNATLAASIAASKHPSRALTINKLQIEFVYVLILCWRIQYKILKYKQKKVLIFNRKINLKYIQSRYL